MVGGLRMRVYTQVVQYPDSGLVEPQRNITATILGLHVVRQTYFAFKSHSPVQAAGLLATVC